MLGYSYFQPKQLHNPLIFQAYTFFSNQLQQQSDLRRQIKSSKTQTTSSSLINSRQRKNVYFKVKQK